MSAAGTTVSAASVVAGTAAAGTATGLAFTGVNVAWEVIAAAVLIGVGGMLWRLAPRRTA